MSLLAPVASVLRAAFVSINMFGLICDNGVQAFGPRLASLSKFGGPILYLCLYGLILFGILIWVDSGSLLPQRKPEPLHAASGEGKWPDDVKDEALSVSKSSDAVRVLRVSKAYGDNRVVDDVSFGVDADTIFALIGPNGAGKTTAFKVIGGDVVPNSGDVLIQGTSVVHNPRFARLSLGVCPQFTAIDSQLTVREHLFIYGRLKGLNKGTEVDRNVQELLRATSLDVYADRLASKLSGGNQRKLALAIALIGMQQHLQWVFLVTYLPAQVIHRVFLSMSFPPESTPR